MATANQTVSLTVTVKDAASKALGGIGVSLARMGSAASSAVGGVVRSLFSLQSAVAGVGVGLLAKSFIDAGSTVEQLQRRLLALTGSQEEANRIFGDAADYAKRVAFEYEEIISTATKLRATIAKTPEDAQLLTRVSSDIAATFGLSLTEATDQIVRAFSAGIGAADLFRERGVSAALGFEAGVTYSVQETRDRILASYSDIESVFRDSAASMGSTWVGLTSMLSDKWFEFRTIVNDAGLFDAAKESVASIDAIAGKLLEENRERIAEITRQAIDSLPTFSAVVDAVVALGHGLLVLGGIAADAWRGIRVGAHLVIAGFARLAIAMEENAKLFLLTRDQAVFAFKGVALIVIEAQTAVLEFAAKSIRGITELGSEAARVVGVFSPALRAAQIAAAGAADTAADGLERLAAASRRNGEAIAAGLVEPIKATQDLLIDSKAWEIWEQDALDSAAAIADGFGKAFGVTAAEKAASALKMLGEKIKFASLDIVTVVKSATADAYDAISDPLRKSVEQNAAVMAESAAAARKAAEENSKALEEAAKKQIELLDRVKRESLERTVEGNQQLLDEELRHLRDLYDANKLTYDQLLQLTDHYRAEYGARMDALRESELQKQQTWSERFTLSIQASMQSMSDTVELAVGVAEDSLNIFGDAMASAASAALEGSKSTKQAFQDMAREVLQQIQRMITRMMVYAAIGAAVGLLFPGVGLIGGAAAGAQAGLGGGFNFSTFAAPRADPVPANGSLARQLAFGPGGTGDLGAAGPTAAGSMRNATIDNRVDNSVININAIEPQTFAKYLASEESARVLRASTREAISRDVATRQGIRNV